MYSWSEPDFGKKHYQYGPVISSVASSSLRDLITSSWSTPGELACSALELQLRLYRERQADSKTASASIDTSTFDEDTASVLQSTLNSLDVDVNTLGGHPFDTLSQAFGASLERLPYSIFCVLRGNATSDNALRTSDIDEWLLQNERWLRDHPTQDWRIGLVRYSSQANVVFTGAKCSNTARTLKREALSGRTILDMKRMNTVELQPNISGFIDAFSALTGGLLKGIEWSNVFIAGGIVLGALLSTDLTKDVEKYKNSDIDLYICGLGPIEANAKVAHIYERWRSNLPAGAESRVLRNSRTITFLSSYPTKRVQIVLKLVKNPKEILLNFDLDPCAMGFDGEDLWMLPRAARAVETGYSTFTMDLISGHYLGQRRASQQRRIFKYADKGFGIRFLPSYIASLPLAGSYHTATSWSSQDIDVHIDCDSVAARARAWTAGLIEVRFSKQYGPPRLSHEFITEAKVNSTDPAGRDALQNFERLMRHVALWEHACRGEIILDNTVFAYQDYDDARGPIGYDDGPHYEWSASFSFQTFEQVIEKCNKAEQLEFKSNVGRVSSVKNLTTDLSNIRRMVVRQTLGEVTSGTGDSIIPIFLPPEVVARCNELILQALSDNGLPSDTAPLTPALDSESMVKVQNREDGLSPIFWRIDSIRSWQMIDRRIDEAYEILWAFRAANAVMEAEDSDRADRLVTQLSKRAIRETPEDEFTTFAKWVTRPPHPIGDGNGLYFPDSKYYNFEEMRMW